MSQKLLCEGHCPTESARKARRVVMGKLLRSWGQRQGGLSMAFQKQVEL